AREDHRLHRRAARGRQCGRRLRRHRAHARDVQAERRAARPRVAGQRGSAPMSGMLSVDFLIEASYFVTAVLFIMGLKRMSSPVTARSGILWAGAGMLVATVV